MVMVALSPAISPIKGPLPPSQISELPFSSVRKLPLPTKIVVALGDPLTSTRRAELVTKIDPPLVTVNWLRTRSGVFVPALLTNKEFAATKRLLTVRQPLTALLSTVIASMVMKLLLPPLAMTSARSVDDGWIVRDQSLAFSHLPLPSIQLFVSGGVRMTPLFTKPP